MKALEVDLVKLFGRSSAGVAYKTHSRGWLRVSGPPLRHRLRAGASPLTCNSRGTMSFSHMKTVSFLSPRLFPSSLLPFLSLFQPGPLEKQVVPTAPPSACLPDPRRAQLPSPLPRSLCGLLPGEEPQGRRWGAARGPRAAEEPGAGASARRPRGGKVATSCRRKSVAKRLFFRPRGSQTSRIPSLIG